jgi:hypothetical protein
MPIPGYVWNAILVTLTTFLTALSAGIEAEVTDFWGPIVLALLLAAINAVKAWPAQPPVIGARSVVQRGFWGRFFLGRS